MGKIDSKAYLIKLMEQYKNLVFSICLKITGDYFTAEDLTQETFISVYSHLQNFDGSNEKAWICRIATNKSLDYMKKKERTNISLANEDLENTVEDGRKDLLTEHINSETMKSFTEKCNNLSPPYKEAAIRYFINGETCNEIAQKTGDKLKTVQTRVARAREMLKKAIRKEDLL